MKRQNYIHWIIICVLTIVVMFFVLNNKETVLKINQFPYYVNDSDTNKFEAVGTFIIKDEDYKNDSNKIQLSTIECYFDKEMCVESMILHNEIYLSNYIYIYKIDEVKDNSFHAKSEINNSELIYNRTLKTLIKNYQLDGKIFPLKLE